MKPNPVGDLIRSYRIKEGINQTEMDRRLGFSRGSTNYLENKPSKQWTEKHEKVAKFLGVSADDLKRQIIGSMKRKSKAASSPEIQVEWREVNSGGMVDSNFAELFLAIAQLEESPQRGVVLEKLANLYREKT